MQSFTVVWMVAVDAQPMQMRCKTFCSPLILNFSTANYTAHVLSFIYMFMVKWLDDFAAQKMQLNRRFPATASVSILDFIAVMHNLVICKFVTDDAEYLQSISVLLYHLFTDILDMLQATSKPGINEMVYSDLSILMWMSVCEMCFLCECELEKERGHLCVLSCQLCLLYDSSFFFRSLCTVSGLISPIHTAVWMRGSCASSPSRPICECLGGGEG